MEKQSMAEQPNSYSMADIRSMIDTIDAQKKMLAAQEQKLLDQNQTLAANSVEIADLRAKVKRLSDMLFGRKTEKYICDDSTQLLPGMEDIPTDEKDEPEVCIIEEHARKKTAHHKAGWNEYPSNLRIEVEKHELPKEKIGNRVLIGYEIRDVLVKGQEYYIKRIMIAKYANPDDALDKVVKAPGPKSPKCLSGDSGRFHYDLTFVANVIVRKLIDHLPFDRQSKILLRQNIRCSRSVMCDWFGKVAHGLERLYDEMVAMILACPVIHADETSLKMQSTGGTKTCWMWVRKTAVGALMTAFYFAEDRSANTARKILGEYIGTIIRDGYAAYENLPAIVAGCWAHVRRKFFEAQDNHREYAERALNLIQQLYKFESTARDPEHEQQMFSNRRKIRKKYSAPVVDRYFELCREICMNEPPKSPIGTAAAYSLQREKDLRQFLRDPRLNIDNNPCENIIRPMCLGRKNWLFVGNAEGGHCLAILESFAATCKDNGIDFEKWLLDTLRVIDETPDDQLWKLLPVKNPEILPK